MVDPGPISDWVVIIAIAIPSSIASILLYVKRNAFRTGKVEATQEGKTVLNSTLLNNVITELEHAKAELGEISVNIHNQGIDIARLQERIKYIQERIDALSADVKDLITSDRTRNSNDDTERYYRSRYPRHDDMTK